MITLSRYPVIGIAGLARTGKDTVADFIVAAIGGYKYSFAKPLRRMLNAGLNIDLDDPFWQARKEDIIPAIGVSPRHMLQTLGTEWGRVCVNPDLWIIMAHQELYRNGAGMVISDVRFENEAAWVRKHEGLVIHLTRPDAENVLTHVSESGIPRHPEDLLLINNGTIEELQIAVRRLLGVV